MRTNIDLQQSELFNTRMADLEMRLERHEDFQRINDEQYVALQELKKIVGEVNWLVLDNFVCSKNAECEYVRNYYYINGINDGKRILS